MWWPKSRWWWRRHCPATGIQGEFGVHRCAHVTEAGTGVREPSFPSILKWPGPGRRHSTELTTSLVPIHYRLGATTPWSMVVAVLMTGVFKSTYLKRRGPESMCITRRDKIGIGTQSPPRHNNPLMCLCEVLPPVRPSVYRSRHRRSSHEPRDDRPWSWVIITIAVLLFMDILLSR